MSSVRYVISLLLLLFASACSEAIPTVTNLSEPIKQTTQVGSISAGAGTMMGSNFKITGKIDPVTSELVGSNFKIKISEGD